jgi:hypothetical protein
MITEECSHTQQQQKHTHTGKEKNTQKKTDTETKLQKHSRRKKGKASKITKTERRLKNKQNKQALNTLWHHQKIQEAKLNLKKKKTNKIYKHKPFDAP